LQRTNWTEESVRAMHTEYVDDNLSLRELGERHGVSGERIHQLFRRYELQTRQVSRLTITRQRREAEAEERQEEIRNTYKQLGSIKATAEAIGLPARYIKLYVKDMPGRSLYRATPSGKQYTTEFVIDCIQRAAQIAGEPLTVPAYNALAPQNGFPAHVTILSILSASTWWEACAKAGVEANQSKGPQSGSITPEDCHRAVLTYIMTHEGTVPTYDEYSKWAKHSDYPSGQTVRVKCRSWTNAVRGALALTD
jgi:predicted DNA-binding protein YlxM (UPF0122 family)